MFGDVLDRKYAFPDYKKIDFIWLPNLIFPKGLVHDFGLFNNLTFLHVSFFVKKA